MGRDKIRGSFFCLLVSLTILVGVLLEFLSHHVGVCFNCLFDIVKMSLKERKEQDKVSKAMARQKDFEKKETLINLISNYPEIWDKTNVYYRDRNLQNIKWKEVSDIMKLPSKCCSNNSNCLKD